MLVNYLDFHMEDIDMATSMVIGTQWGDEGKGKICLLYTSRDEALRIIKSSGSIVNRRGEPVYLAVPVILGQ